MYHDYTQSYASFFNFDLCKKAIVLFPKYSAFSQSFACNVYNLETFQYACFRMGGGGGGREYVAYVGWDAFNAWPWEVLQSLRDKGFHESANFWR